MSTPPPAPAPDDKDWTWVLDRPCPDCGFDAAEVNRDDLGSDIRASVVAWQQVLDRENVRDRPQPNVWSPLEYACHVRDVYTTIQGRVELMLTQDDPEFPNWDQDATALAERYWESDPEVIADELGSAGERLAELLDLITDDQWPRPGRRSNGSVFTIESLASYGLHDVVHHLNDVGAGTNSAGAQ